MAHETQHSAHLVELKQLHHVENKLLQFLPRLAKVVDEPELHDAIVQQIAATRRMVEQLDVILADVGASIDGEGNALMGRLASPLEGSEQLIKTAEFDLALISIARRLDRDEVADLDATDEYPLQAVGANSAPSRNSAS